MSANVDFKITVSGFGADKAAAEPVSDLLADEGLLGDLVEKVGRGRVVFASSFPVVIARSYKYLPELQKRLAKLAKRGVTIELKTRTEGGPWIAVSLGTKSTKPAKKVAPRARNTSGRAGKPAAVTGTPSSQDKLPALPMKHVYVQRHPIDAERIHRPTPSYNAKLVKCFAEELPVHRNHRDWLASTGWDALMSGSVLAPDSDEMWTAARAVAQACAATFAAGMASARVSVPFGDKVVEIDRDPAFVNASPMDWLHGWCCAIFTRDTVCLELLAQVPDEIFRVSRVMSAGAHEPWRGALIACYRGQDPTTLVERAVLLTEPAQRTRLLAPDVARLWSARFHMLLPLFHKDADAFNRALVHALEEHKKFFSKKAECWRLGGFVAAEPAALCALAHDAGLPIEVASEYLPPALIQGNRPAKQSRGARGRS